MISDVKRLDARDALAVLLLDMALAAGMQVDPEELMEDCHRLCFGPREQIKDFLLQLRSIADHEQRQHEFDQLHNNGGVR